MSEQYHYSEYQNHHKDAGYYYGGYGSDDGVDAIKDANAEMGLDPYNSAGFSRAVKNGWIKKKTDKDG